MRDHFWTFCTVNVVTAIHSTHFYLMLFVRPVPIVVKKVFIFFFFFWTVLRQVANYWLKEVEIVATTKDRTK